MVRVYRSRSDETDLMRNGRRHREVTAKLRWHGHALILRPAYKSAIPIALIGAIVAMCHRREPVVAAANGGVLLWPGLVDLGSADGRQILASS